MTAGIFVRSITFIALFISTQLVPSQPIVLSSEIVKLIDGKSYGVTGYKIKLMLQLLLKLNTIQGTGKSGEEGLYLFEGKKYTLAQLTDLEATMGQAQQSSLAKLLEEVKTDFESKVSPFMEDARGAKAQLFALIQESCRKHERTDSFLHTWADAAEGHETEAIHSQLPSFKSLSQFCVDLMMFLKDMINSCPKAVAQYQELKAQYAQHKTMAHSEVTGEALTK